MAGDTPMASSPDAIRSATPEDAAEIARLLHDFNVEFDTPTPPVEVLTARLQRLLVEGPTFAILAGTPAIAVALATARPNVWYDGPVVLLDELYVVPDLRNHGIGTAVIESLVEECRRRNAELVEINVDEDDVDAQRFYERHGWTGIEDATGARAYFYFRSLQ